MLQANKQLLASCYFRGNQAFRAFYVLQGKPAALLVPDTLKYIKH